MALPSNYQGYLGETEQERKAAKKVGLWGYLSSMQFAILILIIIGTLSLVALFAGELQADDAQGGKGIGHALLTLFQMADPFRSWWYRLLLGLLCLSLFACVYERTPIVWRLWSKEHPKDINWIRSIPHAIVRTVDADRNILLGHLSKTWSWKLKSDEFSIAERGRIGMWGPLLTHLGMLLIGIGALVSSFGGYDEHAGAFAGDTIPVPNSNYIVRLDSFRVSYYPLQPGQWVLVDDNWIGRLREKQDDGSWRVEHRRQDGTIEMISAPEWGIRNRFDNNMDRSNIKRYSSYVTVMQEGREVRKQEIVVNSPLRIAGYRFYQSSYDPSRPRIAANYQSVAIAFSDSAAGLNDTLVLKPGVETGVPGDTIRIMAGLLLPHFKMGRDFRAFSESAEFINPAVQLTYRGPSGWEKTQWVFVKFPGMEGGPGRFNYRVASLAGEHVTEEMQTILQVKKNYGDPFLWAGFLICSVGLLFCFYVFHRVLYIEWPAAGQTQVRMTALSRKTTALYTRQIDELIEHLTTRHAV